MGFVFRINFETLATQAIRLQPTGGLAQAGGVARPTLECRTATSALVQALVIPPPVAKPLGRYVQAVQCD